VLAGTPFGPSEAPRPFTAPVTVSHDQLARTTEDVAGYLARHGRVPSTVWLGGVGVPPESYLMALAEALPARLEGGAPPPSLKVKPAALVPAAHVASDDPRKLWSWVILPPNFSAPEMMQLAKRQAWTLKPAIASGER
jgi:hypothetical protein